jgi:SecD/SecF fusion protein
MVVSIPQNLQPAFMPSFISDMKINLGLDLQGGSQLDFSIDTRKVAPEDHKDVIEGVKEVINKRVNNLGVAEPNIYSSKVGDQDHIIVELAGISDLEEAKQKVGKTIQLEFKEENDVDAETQSNEVSQSAGSTLVAVLQSPEDFAVIGETEAKANQDNIFFDKRDFEFADQIKNEEVAAILFNLKPGEIYPSLVQADLGIDLINGKFQEQKGYFILKVTDKKETEREITSEKEVKAAQILISYKDINPEIERSKSEAKDLANQVLEKLNSGEITFADAVLEYSDDTELKESGGILPNNVKNFGPFEKSTIDAALALDTVDQISQNVVETARGIQLLKAVEIIEATTETKTETQVAYEKIFFSTKPDPWKETPLNGQYFKRATVAFDQFARPMVTIEFNSEGGEMFEELTARNKGKRIAIFVGGLLVSAPEVNEKISGGVAQINGNFDIESANLLARDLNTGAIPAPITLTGQYTIGPNLGAESLHKSLTAGALGLVLLLAYMIYTYRVPGVLASAALIAYSVILLFIIKVSLPSIISLLIALSMYFGIGYLIMNSKEQFIEKSLSFLVATFALFFLTFLLSSPVTLTLAGVAGIVLSIGMAVDANVLIFERIKEELDNKLSYKSAVKEGFDKAWSSIRDSNYSSLITCGILYYFGSSIIRGFALNLAAGILISMFSAIVISRTLLLNLKSKDIINNPAKLGLTLKQRKVIKFDKIGNKLSIVSGVLILATIISLFTSGLNTGIDFKGGSFIEIQSEQLTSEITQTVTETVNTFVEKNSLDNSVVIPAGETAIQIKTSYLSEQLHTELLSEITQATELEFTENRFETVGPSISSSLKTKALLSLFIALAAIIIYIATAFREIPKQYNPWKFGLAAFGALVHDVIIILGIFSVFQFEIDTLFVTALLTIIGFSVHDTIVVFDRIRENLKTMEGKKLTTVCNASLTQTLSRSLNTSISTLITLLALVLLGSQSIYLFSLALTLGIAVGTYSSLFIATPILNYLNRK